MIYSRLLALLLSNAMALRAQTTTPARVVTGVVYDSIAHAPLVGAVVQATRVDSPSKRTST